MREKNISIFSILIAILPLSLQAIEYELKIQPVEYLQERFLQGTQVRSGLWNGKAIGLSDDEYQQDEHTELLLPFNTNPNDEILRGGFAYKVARNEAYIQNSQWYRGESAGLFLPEKPLELAVGTKSLFAPGTVWNDFSMEFWIYPTELSGDEELFHWKGRSWIGERPQIQEFAVRGTDGRLQWDFSNFFIKLSYNVELLPEGQNAPLPDINDGEDLVQLSYESITLSSRREIVPRTWSHHLLRYDSSRGVLEYLINGVSEAVVHLTGESGDSFLPYIGDESDGLLRIGANYHGFMDDFRIQRNWVEQPQLDTAEKEPGHAIIGPIDLKPRRSTSHRI